MTGLYEYRDIHQATSPKVGRHVPVSAAIAQLTLEVATAQCPTSCTRWCGTRIECHVSKGTPLHEVSVRDLTSGPALGCAITIDTSASG